MSNTTIGLILVTAIQVLLYLVSASVQAINPDAGYLYDCGNTSLNAYSNGGNCYNNPELTENYAQTNLPTNEVGATGTSNTGNFFTDIFISIGKWFGKLPGVQFTKDFLLAPYKALKLMNLPGEIVFAIGTFWYSIAFFLLVAFFWGRE